MLRYFDVGAHKGGEIRLFLDMVQGPLEVYAFEAHPGLAKKLSKNFEADERVHVFPIALGNTDGEALLHLNSNLVGSSLYKDKNNVIRGRNVRVPVMRFSTWAQANLPEDWKQDCNIIKANIEGAEWDLWHDLEEHKLLDAFDVWLGAKEGHDGWSTDLRKIKSMRACANKLTAKTKASGVYFYRFTAFGPKANSDVAALLKEHSG